MGLSFWQNHINEIIQTLTKEHAEHPSERGLRRAELQSQLRLPILLFNQLIGNLTESGKVVAIEGVIALASHKPTLNTSQEADVARILQFFARSHDNPPTRKELLDLVPDGEPVIRYMVFKNLILELSEGVMFETKHYESIKRQVVAFLKRKGSITIQEMRGLLGFSRKYLIPLLNKLEEEGIIRRKGELRILVEK